MMGASDRASSSAYYPHDSGQVYIMSEPIPCNCLFQPQALPPCRPDGGCGEDCSGLASDLPYLNSSGTGGFPQFGFTTNHYVVQAFILPPLLIAILRGCAAGLGADALIGMVRWLGCALGALVLKKPIESSCGSFPFPGLCDMVASCLTGALTGGLAQKLFPKLGDYIRDLISALTGAFAGGICEAVRAPTPCPQPAPNPPSGGTLGPSTRPFPAV